MSNGSATSDPLQQVRHHVNSAGYLLSLEVAEHDQECMCGLCRAWRDVIAAKDYLEPYNA